MEEIAQQFKEELQELLDRYKDKMSTPQIMHIAQPVFKHTIGFKDNPERLERILNNTVHNLKEINGLKVPAELIENTDSEFKKILQGDFIANPSMTNKRLSEEHLQQILNSGPSFLEQHSLKGGPKCTD